MTFKTLMLNLLHIGRYEWSHATRAPPDGFPAGMDLKTINARAPMSASDTASRYRSGRFAEMTEEQAGFKNAGVIAASSLIWSLATSALLIAAIQVGKQHLTKHLLRSLGTIRDAQLEIPVHVV